MYVEYEVKQNYLPILGYRDAPSELLGERVLRSHRYPSGSLPLKSLRKGDTIIHVDNVWSTVTHTLYGVFLTQIGLRVCIPYTRIDNILNRK